MGKPKRVNLKATVTPITASVPLTFVYGGRQQTVYTDTKGTASAVFQWRGNDVASVSGKMKGVTISDSTRVLC